MFSSIRLRANCRGYNSLSYFPFPLFPFLFSKERERERDSIFPKKFYILIFIFSRYFLEFLPISNLIFLPRHTFVRFSSTVLSVRNYNSTQFQLRKGEIRKSIFSKIYARTKVTLTGREGSSRERASSESVRSDAPGGARSEEENKRKSRKETGRGELAGELAAERRARPVAPK